MITGIYRITNNITNKKYIGQSVNIQSRWNSHKKDMKISNTYLYKSMRKYGFDNFSFDIIEECSIENLNEREKYYIKKEKTLIPNGYNLTAGGDSGHLKSLNSYEDLEKIVDELKNNFSLNISEIADNFNITADMCYKINQGVHWKLDNEDYPLRNGNSFFKVEKYCKDCNKIIEKGRIRCKDCNIVSRRTVERPSRELYLKEVFETGFTKMGEKYGVSSKSIQAWAKSYGLPHLKKDLIEIYKRETSFIEPVKKEVNLGKVYQLDKDTNKVLAVFDNAVSAALSLGDRSYNKHISSVCSGSRKTAYGYKWERR